MMEIYEQKAWNLLKDFRRITPALLMRRFKIKGEFASKICQKIWLRQHAEARMAASKIYDSLE